VTEKTGVLQNKGSLTRCPAILSLKKRLWRNVLKNVNALAGFFPHHFCSLQNAISPEQGIHHHRYLSRGTQGETGMVTFVILHVPEEIFFLKPDGSQGFHPRRSGSQTAIFPEQGIHHYRAQRRGRMGGEQALSPPLSYRCVCIVRTKRNLSEPDFPVPYNLLIKKMAL
jgi:hypothetical protein